jgi:hypothetical protein
MDGYRVYDIYGSYAFDPNTKLRFAFTNLTDVAYAPAVGANFYAAPGRTATVGLASLPDMSSKLIGRVVQNALKPAVSCYRDDTFAIRRILAKEALTMIPTVGLFGAGVGCFAERSCYKSIPHNIVLQAAAELGVAAALILIGLFGSALVSVARRARFDAVARFVFAGLVFMGLESLVSGSLTNAALLFAFMGWSVGLGKGARHQVSADCPEPVSASPSA